jgi:hypothetical protein
MFPRSFLLSARRIRWTQVTIPRSRSQRWLGELGSGNSPPPTPVRPATAMYNVLEKSRSGEPLTDGEKTIHERALVSLLKPIHDDLAAAVFDAYGWPRTLSSEEILERLIALNTERAAAESSGLIRWLRPELGRSQRRHVKFRDVSQKPLCHSSLACPCSSRTTSGRDTLNDVPGKHARPRSKSSTFDVHRIRYGLRSRKLPRTTPLCVCFADERLRHTEVGGRDDRHLGSAAELYVPLLGNTRYQQSCSKLAESGSINLTAHSLVERFEGYVIVMWAYWLSTDTRR